MNTELAEHFESTDKVWTWVVIDASTQKWGLGNDRKEAMRNAGLRANARKTDDMLVAQWTEPTKAVVDVFGRVHWQNPDAEMVTVD